MSALVDRLLDDGYRDVTLVEVSAHALDAVRARLGDRARAVAFLRSDVLDWSPDRAYDVWHDRAVFHFLSDDADRARYVERATEAVRPGGALIVASFAADGPTHCSGLPVRRYTADDLAGTFGCVRAVERTGSTSAGRNAAVHVGGAAATDPGRMREGRP